MTDPTPTPGAPVPSDDLIVDWLDDHIKATEGVGSHHRYIAHKAAAWGYAQAMQDRQKSAEIITSLMLAASELDLWTDSSKVHGSEDFSGLLDRARTWATRLRGGDADG